MRPRAVTRIGLSLLIIVAGLVSDSAQQILRHFSFYRALYSGHPYYVPEGLKTVLQIVFCLLIVWLLSGRNSRETRRIIGLTRPIAVPVIVMFAASLPMWIGLAITQRIATKINLTDLFFLSVWFPIVEEIVYRGFLFSALRRFGAWSFWPAALLNAAVFGFGHIEQGSGVKEMAALFVLTGTGGVVFCWLFTQWGNNVWAPTGLHMFMNMSWQFFAVSDNALGGWLPFALQLGAIVSAVTLTVIRSVRMKRSSLSTHPYQTRAGGPGIS